MALTSKLSAIGDAIRAKAGTTTKYTLADMPTAIKNLPSGATSLIGKWCEGSMTSISTSDLSSINSTASSLFGGKTITVTQPKVTQIGTVFRKNTDIQYVTLDGVTTLDSKAFDSCTNLKSVTLNSCTSMGNNNVFNSCSNLTTVEMSNLGAITDGAFSNCSKLSTVDFTACTSIGSNAFNSCSSLASSMSLIYCKAVGEGAFANCSKLPTFYAPQCLTVGGQVFSGCYSLKTVVLGLSDSMSELPQALFQNCYSLTAVVFMNELRSTPLTFSNQSVFSNCYHLTGQVDSTYNPNGDKDCYIYVPDTQVSDYQSASCWTQYASQIKPLSEYTG